MITNKADPYEVRRQYFTNNDINEALALGLIPKHELVESGSALIAALTAGEASGLHHSTASACAITNPSRAMASNGPCALTSIAANSAAIVPAGSVIPA